MSDSQMITSQASKRPALGGRSLLILVALFVSVIVVWIISYSYFRHPFKNGQPLEYRIATNAAVGEAMAITSVLFSGLGFVALIATVWLQRRQIEAAIQGMEESTRDMKKSIDQANRAAGAMENFAESAAISAKAATESSATIKDTMTRQLRAYLCVNFFVAIPQNLETKYRFEVRLHLINVGHTPGYRVSYKARADILPFPLPQDFAFSLPDTPNASESTLGNGQNMILTGVVDQLYSEENAAEIKAGLQKRLYIFGTATYEDAYKANRHTNFCFSVIWLSNGNSLGVFTRRHNDAD